MPFSKSSGISLEGGVNDAVLLFSLLPKFCPVHFTVKLLKYIFTIIAIVIQGVPQVGI